MESSLDYFCGAGGGGIFVEGVVVLAPVCKCIAC